MIRLMNHLFTIKPKLKDILSNLEMTRLFQTYKTHLQTMEQILWIQKIEEHNFKEGKVRVDQKVD